MIKWTEVLDLNALGPIPGTFKRAWAAGDSGYILLYKPLGDEKQPEGPPAWGGLYQLLKKNARGNVLANHTTEFTGHPPDIRTVFAWAEGIIDPGAAKPVIDPNAAPPNIGTVTPVEDQTLEPAALAELTSDGLIPNAPLANVIRRVRQ